MRKSLDLVVTLLTKISISYLGCSGHPPRREYKSHIVTRSPHYWYYLSFTGKKTNIKNERRRGYIFIWTTFSEQHGTSLYADQITSGCIINTCDGLCSVWMQHICQLFIWVVSSWWITDIYYGSGSLTMSFIQTMFLSSLYRKVEITIV